MKKVKCMDGWMDVVPSNRNVNCSRQKKKKKLTYDTQNKIKIRLRESKSEMIHSITELHAETIQYSQQTTIKISNWQEVSQMLKGQVPNM